MEYYDSFYGKYRTNIFTDVHANSYTTVNEEKWDDPNNFLQDWKDSPFYSNGFIDDSSITLIYWLLYSNYGNSNIAASDENRFKTKLFSLIFQYAPTWLKKLDIQNEIRKLDITGVNNQDLFVGTKRISNSALNPQTTPGVTTVDELTYINSQNTEGVKKSKLDAYAQLWEMLETDLTDAFVKVFKKLFIFVVSPDRELLYESEENV